MYELFNLYSYHNLTLLISFQSLLELLYNVRLVLTGDPIDASESSLIVCNHRTRVDWNFIWSALFHAAVPTTGHNAKLVLKDQVKEIPGVGKDFNETKFLYYNDKSKTC